MALFPYTWNATSWRYWCSNERNWLIALNSFILASGILLSSAAISAVVLTRQEGTGASAADASDNTSVYNTWLALAVTGCFQVFVAIVGIIAADKVSLHMMVVYFWLVFLVAMAMAMFSIAALGFHYSFEVWIKHHWIDPALAEMRKEFCEEGTYDTLCAVPVAGYPYGSRDAWCQAEHGSTECADVQDEALEETNDFVVKQWMTVAGSIALSSVLEMLASLILTVRLVTVPIIMRSMQSTITYFMVLPVVATIVMGWLYTRYEDMYEFDVLVEVHYVTGAVLLAWAVVGILAGHLRHRRLLQTYIAGLVVVLVFYLVLVGLTAAALASLEEGFAEKSDEDVEGIACAVGAYNCCCCDEATPACPEWSSQELANLGLVFLKLGLATLLLCVVFVVAGLVASLLLHDNLKGYESDYI